MGEASLGSGINGAFRQGSLAGVGGDIDYLAFLLLHHFLTHKLAAKKYPSEVGIHYVVPVFPGEFLRQLSNDYSGVIDKDIYFPVAIDYLGHKCRYRRLLADIGGNGDGF